MNGFKQVLLFLCLGALLGLTVATLAMPRYLAWDNSVGSGLAQCECVRCAQETADRVISAQLKGAAAGGGLGLILGIVWVVKRRKGVTVVTGP